GVQQIAEGLPFDAEDAGGIGHAQPVLFNAILPDGRSWVHRLSNRVALRSSKTIVIIDTRQADSIRRSWLVAHSSSCLWVELVEAGADRMGIARMQNDQAVTSRFAQRFGTVGACPSWSTITARPGSPRSSRFTWFTPFPS